MKAGEYDRVCYRTEQRDEPVVLYHLKSKVTGVSFGCTSEGETVQVRLENGELDSWVRSECAEISENPGSRLQTGA